MSPARTKLPARTDRPVASDGPPPVDIIAVLEAPQVDTAWVTTAPAQLALGGTSLQPLDDSRILEVDLLEERGSEIRIGVRHGFVRFAIWTSRSNLHAVLASEQRMTTAFTTPNTFEVVLSKGARVTPLDTGRERTRVRYTGAFEVEGTVPTSALTTRGPSRRSVRRLAGGQKPLLVTPGANIRSEPRVGSSVLALAAYSTTMGIVKPLDNGWYEVNYVDDDVRVHGFVSRQDPPGAVQPRRTTGFAAKTVGPNRIAGGTCLYASGEVVGLAAGSISGSLVPSTRPGWFTFTVETPWDMIDFEVHGPTENDLDRCGSVSP